MDLQQIEKLVQIIENSSMLEFSIQEGDTKIKMSRRGTAGVPGEAAITIAQTAPAAQAEEEAEDELTSHLRLSALSTLLRHRKQKPS
jgi:Biotin carboxyl carrier protein